MRCPLTPITMAVNKQSESWQGCGGKGALVHCGWDCEQVQSLRKTVWRVSKFKIRPQ